MNLREILNGFANQQQKFLHQQGSGRTLPAKQRSIISMNDDPKKNNNLPVPIDDEFDAGGQTDRLIQGTILRCVDGRWADREGVSFPAGTMMVAFGTTQACQRWQNGLPIETITTKPLPDVEQLNSVIPETEWEIGIGDKPRPPWVLQHVVYLLDPRDASIFTYINGTTGAAIAVERLSQKVRSMRLLRGQRVSPIVKLDSRPMTTKFGQKMRPEFTIVDWRELGGGDLENKPAPQLEHAKPADKIGKPVKPVTAAEEMNDKLPW